MKSGDYVWATVSRDRERLCKLIELSYGNAIALIETPDGKRKSISIESIREAVPEPGKETGGTKHDDGKNRLELIPVEAIEQIGLAYTFGAKKYADNNWRGGFKWTRLVAALLRHTYSWMAGESKDPESGLSHLAHAGACLTMLIAHEQLNYGEDDRVKTKTTK